MNSESVEHGEKCVTGNDTSSLTSDEKGCPDADTIKMFIGQIPKIWDEQQLTEYFEEFGPIYQLSVLRDKETASSRGCCFVTYFHRKDAINAQNALHNVRTFPGLSHPIQMKPADVENKNAERKLFIGMLPKAMDEEGVRALFREFGQVEDCSILRDEGKSKGCAFLTFVSRSCAHQAIRKMHHSQIFEGCSKPVVVKFADSGREKGVKRFSDVKSDEGSKPNSGGPTNNQGITQLTTTGVETLTSLVTLLQQPNIIPLLETARVLQQLQSAQTVTSPANLMLKTDQNHQQNAFKLPTLLQPNLHAMQQGGLLGLSPGMFFQQPVVGGPSLSPAALTLSLPTSVSNAALHSVMSTTLPKLPMFSPSSSASVPRTEAANSAQLTEKYHRGPDGCNLFIYHLPQDFVDTDLYSLFSHFGQILSAKVFVDKQTNLSKCFGFVSFAAESSAQNAISGMNGFQIGAKRLKVQLKRSDAKPYEKPIA